MTKKFTNEGLAILASELKLQLKYIREDGNKYHAIDHAEQLVNRLKKAYPLLSKRQNDEAVS